MRQNADAHNRSDKRNIGIDLLRLFFAIVVVVHHIYGSQIHNEINYGYLAVEFFFFVSGYYIIQNDCEKDTVHYLLRLMKKLLPIVISAQIVFVTFELLYFEHDLSDYPSILFYSLFQALGLQTLGFPIYNMNDVLWFISAYFFVSSFIYAIMRRYGKQVIIDLLPISCGLIGLIYLFCGNIIGIWSHDFYNQWLLLRSFCDFNFGILAYVITSGLSRIKFKESGRHLMIAITIMVSLIIGIFMFLPFEHTYVEIVLFGLIWALLVLVMMIDQWVKWPAVIEKVSIYAPTVSILLFLSHFYWCSNITRIMTDCDTFTSIVCIVSLILATAVISLIMSKIIKRACNLIKETVIDCTS